MASVLVHAAFDLVYGRAVMCLVGRCQHKHHRVAAQLAAALVGALILVHAVG